MISRWMPIVITARPFASAVVPRCLANWGSTRIVSDAPGIWVQRIGFPISMSEVTYWALAAGASRAASVYGAGVASHGGGANG